MSVLTAECFGPPVLGLPTSMDTLSREFRQGVAQTGGICIVSSALFTVTEVCNTGSGEGGNIQQTATAVESGPFKDLLTHRFL